jgi:hypothetical protein
VATKYNLILFQCGAPASRHRSISRATVALIQRELDRAITTPKKKTEIEIWLDSPGGDAHATYKLLLDLRQRCTRLTAVIPDYAKSAATLLLLGVDEIWMAAAADLGPLDVQISHPDRETQPLSGLDIAGSFSYLSEFAMTLVLTGAAACREATGLPRIEVLKVMQQFTAEFLRPCMEKIDPHVARRTVYQLKVAERYAETILGMRDVAAKHLLKPELSKRLIRRLVHDYPVHEFCIVRDEAIRLGLPVFEAEKHPNWKAIKQFYERFMDGENTIIRVINETEAAKANSKSKGNAKPDKKRAGAKNGFDTKTSKENGQGSNGKVAPPTRPNRRLA